MLSARLSPTLMTNYKTVNLKEMSTNSAVHHAVRAILGVILGKKSNVIKRCSTSSLRIQNQILYPRLHTILPVPWHIPRRAGYSREHNSSCTLAYSPQSWGFQRQHNSSCTLAYSPQNWGFQRHTQFLLYLGIFSAELGIPEVLGINVPDPSGWGGGAGSLPTQQRVHPLLQLHGLILIFLHHHLLHRLLPESNLGQPGLDSSGLPMT